MVHPHFIYFSLLLGLTVVLFVASRNLRAACTWGALWGATLGICYLMPRLLAVHHMPRLSMRQWLVLEGGFLAVSAVGGAAISVATSLPLITGFRAVRREFRNPAWAYSLVAAVAIPAVYLSLSGLIEWTNFARPPSVDSYVATVGQGLALQIVTVALLLALYFRRAAKGWDPDGRLLHRVLLVALIAGCAAVPLRLETAPRAIAAKAEPLVAVVGRAASPLLVIGLDGGNWRTLMPLIEQGRAQTFSHLMATGVHGDVEALWPPFWSTPAWGAILTGYSQDEIGVHEDLAASMKGFPSFELPLTLDLALNPLFAVELALIQLNFIETMPTPRQMLARAPVWERLSKAGVKAAVVRFPFTYPATGQADYVISNRVVVDLWDRLGVEPGIREQLVAPPWETSRLLARFSAGRDEDDAPLVSRLLGTSARTKPRDAIIDPLEVIGRVASIDAAMNDAAIDLLRRDRGIDAMFIHVTGFDNICHALWQYRFPDDFMDERPDRHDIENLGPVVDRYLEWLDSQIQELIEAFPSPPNVLIVADHGAEASQSYPLWRGWHGSSGVFLAAGPDIGHLRRRLMVSYYDILPTILELQRFRAPEHLRGRSVLGRPPASRGDLIPVDRTD